MHQQIQLLDNRLDSRGKQELAKDQGTGKRAQYKTSGQAGNQNSETMHSRDKFTTRDIWN